MFGFQAANALATESGLPTGEDFQETPHEAAPGADDHEEEGGYQQGPSLNLSTRKREVADGPGEDVALVVARATEVERRG